MKIGIMGAPGAGKTALATALAAELDLEVIDSYVEDLENEMGYQFGRFATYIGNLAIMIRRHTLERSAREEGDDYVTCGTPLDTVTYIAAGSYFGGDEGWQRRSTGTLIVAGCMADDLWEYDHVVHLPGGNREKDGFIKRVMDELPLGIELFEHDTLMMTPESSVEERVKLVLAAL